MGKRQQMRCFRHFMHITILDDQFQKHLNLWKVPVPVCTQHFTGPVSFSMCIASIPIPDLFFQFAIYIPLFERNLSCCITASIAACCVLQAMNMEWKGFVMHIS